MDQNKSELNPELFDMMRQGKLSANKILALISLRGIVDKFASKPFLEEEKLAEIKERTGVEPDILTWGDYFQTEVASRYFDKTDSEFSKIVDTIRFDLISSHLIFSGKPDYFTDSVRGQALVSRSVDSNFWTLEDEENVHLEILLDYFEQMGLEEKPLAISDRIWYESFELKQEAV
ncbi:hypothetical protein EHQ27_16725 [Leptospira wolffii]|uniref:Uncharacterized protein n=1 Tax=Leptospira wolffii TaxID=409998 RepID=A0A2M9Z7J8_9LEPT|nr:hypothetical protein [Leptospira wolffii]PJZ64364.1 hypothetical protein CH371_18255 [Leptospira wolffii]TGK58326.1 hypothetical protein EHQ32_13660 [Leptospira wolffii]TGK66297.1 hypothetical protein EHQ27_16725 [Leptospira wolffii]TGK69004.1 hypothetical protein EHQ35_19530 [Leptospira wolffii]TGL27356.1 hypothetical protein EHQ57_17510 [Leptospira wolffii]